jgi:hypothetical protein
VPPCDTEAVTRRAGTLPLLCLSLTVLFAASSCANIHEVDKSREEARTKGKYHVRLTDKSDEVQGTCKFVRAIQPEYDPTGKPTNAQLPDYYREQAVYYGADTVLVRGQLAEAYQCGPVPLNPDGTPKSLYGQPQ